jgi:hypothetical protein
VSPADVVSLVSLGVDAAKEIHDWIHNDGPKPEEALAQLPDLLAADLASAALQKRAGRAGT